MLGYRAPKSEASDCEVCVGNIQTCDPNNKPKSTQRRNKTNIYKVMVFYPKAEEKHKPTLQKKRKIKFKRKKKKRKKEKRKKKLTTPLN